MQTQKMLYEQSKKLKEKAKNLKRLYLKILDKKTFKDLNYFKY